MTTQKRLYPKNGPYIVILLMGILLHVLAYIAEGYYHYGHTLNFGIGLLLGWVASRVVYRYLNQHLVRTSLGLMGLFMMVGWGLDYWRRFLGWQDVTWNYYLLAGTFVLATLCLAEAKKNQSQYR
jgi:hypothetical protein